MPDWLRTRLIEFFTPEQEERVRRAIEDLLISVVRNPDRPVQLEIAAEQTTSAGSWKRVWQKILSGVKRRWWLMRLHDLAKAEPEDSQLRDYVFLSFMSGRKPRKLMVNVPDILRRVFFKGGVDWLGLKPV